MTADLTEADPVATHIGSAANTSTTTHNPEPDDTADNHSYEQNRHFEEILDFLSINKHIIFKSQQIDDPELHRNEKVQIARDIYNKSPQLFLMRFGSYLDERHLTIFTQIAAPYNEHTDEIGLLIADYRNKLHTRKRDVKNRRYAAMQKLIIEGEYFSEQEMMKRAPELYQELVGQYLSEAEKKQRDTYDVKNTTFSGILMHTMEQQQLQDVLKLADKENIKSMQQECDFEKKITKEDETTQSTFVDSEEDVLDKECTTEDDIPNGFRQQWGNFDNEQIACSTSHQAKKRSKEKPESNVVRLSRLSQADTFITAGERELLRQEFIGIMREQFLSGGDQDFDYTLVDDNTQLDDLSLLNQDKEDEYFEQSDDYTSDEGVITKEGDRSFDDDESEDELDIFMNHLNRHHSLQQH
ncbi:coiled-coil domain-containing protein 97 [Eurosta solidaginis]|uniref:coiled-coil domain-containing protein 97 n=1 Tax=Eurosta solidaginis TaxID=178769 RepID=UPI00353065AC